MKCLFQKVYLLRVCVVYVFGLLGPLAALVERERVCSSWRARVAACCVVQESTFLNSPNSDPPQRRRDRRPDPRGMESLEPNLAKSHSSKRKGQKAIPFSLID
jgi:hypothetical protein